MVGVSPPTNAMVFKGGSAAASEGVRIAVEIEGDLTVVGDQGELVPATRRDRGPRAAALSATRGGHLDEWRTIVETDDDTVGGRGIARL